MTRWEYGESQVVRRRAQDVADAAYRAEHGLLELGVELSSQVSDVDVDDVRLLDVGRRLSPDLARQLGAADRCAGVSHQVVEQLEFAVRQDDLSVAAMDLTCDRIEHAIADSQ